MRTKTLLIVSVLLILVGLVVYEYGYLRVQAELASLKEEQEIKARTLGKVMAILSQKPALEKRLQALKEQRKAGESNMIDGQTTSLASASMQETIKGIITGRGGSISSERAGKVEDLMPANGPNPAKDSAKETKEREGKVPGVKKEKKKAEKASRFKIITVSIDATVPDSNALKDILYSIETRVPNMVIKELDARVKNFRDPRELMVRIEVASLYGGK